MSFERIRGGWMVSAWDKHDVLFSQRYFDYTKKEAAALFKEELKRHNATLM